MWILLLFSEEGLMTTFNNIINSVNGVIWSTALVVIIAAAGIIFTIATKGIQFRRFGDMCRLLTEHHEDENGESLSAFQSFATTVGARVGMGNIAGVATAIFFGGPGAVVWMWILALLGGATSIVECSLAQAYKTRQNGEFIGGPQYYMERALHCKPLSVCFAIGALIGPGLLMPPLQTQSVAKTFEQSFHLNYVACGVVLAILVGIVICGGVTRIGRVAELLAPVMCVVFLIFGLIVFFMNITKVPATFALMFKCAFGQESMYGGIIGSMISWGVKRGLYSNEAGQGSGAIVAATAECSHPVKQGLVQGLSVYIDTLVVCSVTALTILLTGMYNVSADGTAAHLIHEGIPGVEYGVLWMQDALENQLGTWSGAALSIMIALFVFTSLMGYYYQAESNLRYLTHGNKTATWIFRGVFVFANILGVIVNSQVIWSMGDTGAGIMAWFNVIAILLLVAKAATLCRDYDKQRKAGLDPMFDPAILGIDDEAKVWEKYAKIRREREAKAGAEA
jgi:AGCS family alanine or glycine:cation symporter